MNSSRLPWKQIVGLVGLALIGASAGYAWSHRKTVPSSEQQTQTGDAKKYITLQAFASSTLQEAPAKLLEEFKKGSMLEAGSWDVPGTDGIKLVAATPTLTSEREPIGCGDTHPLCGLYLVSPATTTLVTWGDPLRGFGGVRGFVDADHARIWTAWSFMAYTMAEERSLDLRNGSSTPLVLMELDNDGSSVEFTVTRNEKKTVLTAKGMRENGKDFPVQVTTSVDGKSATSLSADLITRLAVVAKAGEKQVAITLSEATLPDLQSGKMIVSLYGKSFTLDPDSGALAPNENF